MHAHDTAMAVLDEATGKLQTRKPGGRPHELVGCLEQLERSWRAAYEAGSTGYALARRAGVGGVVRACAPEHIQRHPTWTAAHTPKARSNYRHTPSCPSWLLERVPTISMTTAGSKNSSRVLRHPRVKRRETRVEHLVRLLQALHVAPAISPALYLAAGASQASALAALVRAHFLRRRPREGRTSSLVNRPVLPTLRLRSITP